MGGTSSSHVHVHGLYPGQASGETTLADHARRLASSRLSSAEAEARTPIVIATRVELPPPPPAPSAPPLGVDGHPAQDCPVCLGPLSRSSNFVLPCGHHFHSMCCGMALQVSAACPSCRTEVQDSTYESLASQLQTDPTVNGDLASEVLVSLRSRAREGRDASSGISEEATIDAMRSAVRRGDANKVPSIAALLGRGAGAQARSLQPPAVRVAAVAALRSLVPLFPDTWAGHVPVLSLLRGVATTDADEEVRCSAMRCLGEVGRKGEEASFLAVRCVLEDRCAGSDLRDAAANALQALSVRGDLASMRLALLALKDSDDSVRSVGWATLAQVCGPEGACPEFLPDLAAVAADRGLWPEVRAQALELVAQLEEKGGLFGIGIATTAAMEDRDEDVAVTALQSLRRMCRRGDAETVAQLAQLARASRDRPERLRSEALGVIVQVAKPGDAVATATAAALLTDPEPSVAAAACDLLKKLGQRGDTEIVPSMLELLRSRESEVRRMAAEVLGYVAHPQDSKATAALEKLARSGDFEASMAAERALGQLR